MAGQGTAPPHSLPSPTPQAGIPHPAPTCTAAAAAGRLSFELAVLTAHAQCAAAVSDLPGAATGTDRGTPCSWLPACGAGCELRRSLQWDGAVCGLAGRQGQMRAAGHPTSDGPAEHHLRSPAPAAGSLPRRARAFTQTPPAAAAMLMLAPAGTWPLTLGLWAAGCQAGAPEQTSWVHALRSCCAQAHRARLPGSARLPQIVPRCPTLSVCVVVWQRRPASMQPQLAPPVHRLRGLSL